jgi:hypothetical protein
MKAALCAVIASRTWRIRPMKIKRPILALTLLCLLFALVGWTTGRSTATAPVQWEYKESCSPKDMDKLDAEGWELVAAAQNGVVVCLFYKRQKCGAFESLI